MSNEKSRCSRLGFISWASRNSQQGKYRNQDYHRFFKSHLQGGTVKEIWKWKWSHSIMSDSLRPHGLGPTRLLCPWDFLGHSIGVDCHFLLQGIFPIQGSNPGLPHCRQTLYRLSQEYIMRNAGLEKTQAGIKIARRNINNLRYANDTTLMAESEEELKSLLDENERGEWKSWLKTQHSKN